jgi:hypothetical protein
MKALVVCLIILAYAIVIEVMRVVIENKFGAVFGEDKAGKVLPSLGGPRL